MFTEQRYAFSQGLHVEHTEQFARLCACQEVELHIMQRLCVSTDNQRSHGSLQAQGSGWAAVMTAVLKGILVSDQVLPGQLVITQCQPHNDWQPLCRAWRLPIIVWLTLLALASNSYKLCILVSTSKILRRQC